MVAEQEPLTEHDQDRVVALLYQSASALDAGHEGVELGQLGPEGRRVEAGDVVVAEAPADAGIDAIGRDEIPAAHKLFFVASIGMCDPRRDAVRFQAVNPSFLVAARKNG